MRLDAFLGPGHGSTVIGCRPYEWISRDFGMPSVCAGFEPLDLLQSDTPDGRTTSPTHEQPAAEMPDGESAEQGTDLGSHISGTPKGERSGA